MKQPVRTLFFCSLIFLAACESGDAPGTAPAPPAATVAPARVPAETAADDPAAIKAIKALPENERQQAYLQALQDPAAEVRAAAAKKIKPVGDAMNRLAYLIVNDPSAEVRIATTWSLEKSEGAERPQAAAALVQCLADKDVDVVVECIQSLAFLDDRSTIVYLQPLLTHRNRDVRNAAFEAIKWME